MKKIIAMLIVLVGFLASCTNQVTTENSTGSAVLDRIYKSKKSSSGRQRTIRRLNGIILMTVKTLLSESISISPMLLVKRLG